MEKDKKFERGQRLTRQTQEDITNCQNLIHQGEKNKAERTNYNIFSHIDLNTSKNKKWIVNKYIATNSVNMLYGASGTGKTYIIIDLICSLIFGADKWCEMPIKTRPQNILYYCGEGGDGIKSRFISWIKTRYDDPSEQEEKIKEIKSKNIYFNDTTDTDSDTNGDNFAEMVLIGQNENEYNKFCSYLSQLQFDKSQNNLIIFDTLSTTTDGDENKTDEMAKLTKTFYRIAQRFKATIIVIHHTRKDDNEPRGSNTLRANLDGLFLINENEKYHDYELHNTKNKYANRCEKILFTKTEPVEIYTDEDGEIITDITYKYIPTPIYNEDEEIQKTSILQSVKHYIFLLMYLYEKQPTKRYTSDQCSFTFTQFKKFVSDYNSFNFTIENMTHQNLPNADSNLSNYLYKLVNSKQLKKENKRGTPYIINTKFKKEYDNIKNTISIKDNTNGVNYACELPKN